MPVDQVIALQLITGVQNNEYNRVSGGFYGGKFATAPF